MQVKKYIRYVAIACLAMLPLIAAEYRGQVKFGGLPLPGATITATQGDKKITAVSDLQGTWSFPDLPDGDWSLQVEMPGFSPVKQDVTTGSALPGPAFELKMLALDQIEAVAAPPAPVGPSLTANPTPAASAAPNSPAPAPVSAAKPANGKAGAAPAAAASAFQRTDLGGSAGAPPAAPEPAPEVTSELNQRAADGFLINGSAQNGAASPFAQNPAFGNNRKGGPRLYNGNIALVDSNSIFDAASFSLTGQQTPKLPFNTLTGSFNFGGPIKIPHLLERNGPQFTVNYQRVENRNSSVNTGLMPNAADRAGDFSQAVYSSGKLVQIYDPQSGQPFSGDVIPPSRISQQAQALLPYYPAPNFAGSSAYNYQVPLINNTHTDSFSTRVNKNFLRRNFISGIFGLQDTRSDNNSLLNFLDLNRSLGMQATLSYRRTYTPRFYGTFNYQFSRQTSHSIPFFSNRVNVAGEAGITGDNQQPLNWGPPTLQFNQSPIQTLSDGNASTNHNQTSWVYYVGTWNHNRHNLTFGGDFRWQQFNAISQQNPRGTFSFTGSATQQIVNGVPVAGTGYDFADFMFGTPDTSAIAYGNADKYLRAKQPDAYLTDDWKISPGLSLSLGMRWEYTSPVIEKYGRLVNLDIAAGYSAIAPVVGNNPTGTLTGQTYPDSLVKPYKHEFEPRPAFAWRPFPASSMVVRGGYGIYYNTQVYQQFATRMAQQSPLSTSLSVANSAANPLTLARGFYAPPNVISNTFAIDPNFKVGYAQVWNLSVQRDLPGALVMVATYTGTKGTHLLQAFVPNTYPTGATNPCPNCPSGYTYYTSNGNSTRQSGTLQLRRRLHNGFTASLQYTYSKSIDDAAALGGGSLGTPAQNWLNLEGERGPSTIDQRHLANTALQYTSGMGVGGGTLLSGWRGRLIKDWTFVDAINVGTGLPLTPIYLSTVPGTGLNGVVRANYTGAPIYDAPAGYFLNPAAVAVPAAGQWGNAAGTPSFGPGQFSMQRLGFADIQNERPVHPGLPG